LVENAVHHGIMPLACGGTISIAARIDGESLQLRVEDDGRGAGVSPARPAGIGLANSVKRLDELFGERAKLEFGPGSSGGVAVDITLPLVHQYLSARTGVQAPMSTVETVADSLPRLT
jgi:LytS/YehU family sensor histidine kinase